MATLAETIRAEVVAALRAADRHTGGERGAQQAAADALGITRHTLRRLRERYGVRPDGTAKPLWCESCERPVETRDGHPCHPRVDIAPETD